MIGPFYLHQIDIDGVMSTHNFFCWNFPGGLASLATLFGTTGASLYYESFATYLSFAIYLGHGQFST